ncbi:MAG: hypothetical protein GXO91_11190 [FCB group bacterium]|nr:hypothetical protein [FCB group bacterium]
MIKKSPRRGPQRARPSPIKVRFGLLSGVVFLIVMGLSRELVTDRPCDDCHEEQGWHTLLPFDHSAGSFALKGQHQHVDCSLCHTGSTLAEKHAFKETSSRCADCHFDPHSDRFGFDCDRCHTTNDWLDMNWRDAHDNTFFPLLGVHKLLECSECHLTINSEDVGLDRPDFACESCHADQFDGVDAHDPYSTRYCEMCHNPFAWAPAQVELHDIIFRIYSGAHNNRWTDCTTECHINENNYADFSCGLNGACHEHDQNKMDSEHNGKSGYAYESNRCYSCHG